MTAARLDTIIEQNVKTALAEDLGNGDLTARLIPDQTIKGKIISRETAVLCGQAWCDATFRALDADTAITWLARDGDRLTPNQTLCTIEGNSRALLSGERTALNFLQTLSATATQTRAYVDAVADTHTKILDTRKTLPGLRQAQKYAVKCGGGENHRMGLYDAILIKENHIQAAGSVKAALAEAQKTRQAVWIEIEVETLNQLDEAIAAGAKRILLDNFDLTTLKQAVDMAGGQAQLEASGNIELSNVHDYALTGVDFISIGAITKHIRAIDLSMQLL